MVHSFVKLRVSKSIWFTLLVLVFSGCGFFDKTVSKPSPSTVEKPTPTPVDSGDIALVLDNDSAWCWKRVITLKSDGMYTNVEYQGTFVANEDRGRYTMSDSNLVFSDIESKKASDSAFSATPGDITYSLDVSGTQYTLARLRFGSVVSTEVYESVSEIDLGSCYLKHDSYMVSTPFPCYQSIFKTNAEYFNHKEYREENGVATLQFEFKGSYSLQNGKFLAQDVSKRTDSTGVFVPATYTHKLFEFTENEFKIAGSEAFPNGESAVTLLPEANPTRVVCFDPPEVPQEDLVANYYVDSIRKPIFQKQCAPCHILEDGSSPSEVQLQGWSMTDAGVSERLTSGKPFDSKIFKQTLNRKMPLGVGTNGRRYLTPEELGKLYIWITKGAPGLN